MAFSTKVEDGPDAFKLSHDGNVVQISEQILALNQLTLNLHQSGVLPQGELEEHHRVSMFSSLSLHNCVRGSFCIFQKVT